MCARSPKDCQGCQAPHVSIGLLVEVHSKVSEMARDSRLLDTIINHKNQTFEAKVVFVDIVSYSKRRSQSQASVINRFMLCLDKARQETAKKFIEYSQNNKISFLDDLIVLPTGDGAVVCFPFEGLNDVHLFFAQELMAEVISLRLSEPCEKFNENGWCNCHDYFSLTVGIAEGKCVLYRDLNGNFNIAGSAVNLAARIMGKADADQILFSDDAYWQLIDLVEDPHMDEKFRRYENVRIKHGEKISIYQYIGSGSELFNKDPVEGLDMGERLERLRGKMADFGMPSFPYPDEIGEDKIKGMFQLFEQVFETLAGESIKMQAEDAARPSRLELPRGDSQ